MIYYVFLISLNLIRNLFIYSCRTLLSVVDSRRYSGYSGVTANSQVVGICTFVHSQGALIRTKGCHDPPAQCVVASHSLGCVLQLPARERRGCRELNENARLFVQLLVRVKASRAKRGRAGSAAATAAKPPCLILPPSLWHLQEARPILCQPLFPPSQENSVEPWGTVSKTLLKPDQRLEMAKTR